MPERGNHHKGITHKLDQQLAAYTHTESLHKLLDAGGNAPQATRSTAPFDWKSHTLTARMHCRWTIPCVHILESGQCAPHKVMHGAHMHI